MTTQPEAKQVPLVERLEAVPADARLAVNDGPFSTSFYPVGAMAHEAADKLRHQHAVIAELLEALKDMHSGLKYIRETHGDLYGVGWDRSQEKAEAAIAKAEEVKP